MKITLFLFALFAIGCLSAAQPVPEEEAQLETQLLADEDSTLTLDSPPLNRQKRATCDLLSGFGVEHSACAAGCVARGRNGGYCNDQRVCICR